MFEIKNKGKEGSIRQPRREHTLKLLLFKKKLPFVFDEIIKLYIYGSYNSPW